MAASATTFSQEKKPRARDIGIPFDGTPGKYNAITDVAGVEVGHTTLVEGTGKLEKGKGPVEQVSPLFSLREKNMRPFLRTGIC